MTSTVRLFPAASQHRPFGGKVYSLWERVASEKRATFIKEVCSHCGSETSQSLLHVANKYSSEVS